MKHKILFNTDGKEKQFDMGFSFYSLILGPFYALYKLGFISFIIQFILALFTMGVSWLIFPFFMNKKYVMKLVDKGEYFFTKERLASTKKKKEEIADAAYEAAAIAEAEEEQEKIMSSEIEDLKKEVKEMREAKESKSDEVADGIVTGFFGVGIGQRNRNCSYSCKEATVKCFYKIKPWWKGEQDV